MKTNLGLRIEEILLLFIISLTFLEFFDMLSPFFDFLKNIISWACLAYMLYHAGLSDIFFGKKRSWFDASLLITYFLFMMKGLTGYAYTVAEETSLLHNFFSFTAAHATLIEFTSLTLGAILLILLTFFITFFAEFHSQSLLFCLSSHPHPERKIIPSMKRFITTYFVLLGFFVIVFNLLMEWVAIVLDAPILLFAILISVAVLLIKRRFNTEGFIYHFGSLGEQFYDKFIHLFQRKETILLGISGMLVLHLFNEFATFILPLLVPVVHGFYAAPLAFSERSNLYALLFQQLLGASSPLDTFSIVFLYFFNILAALFLFFSPLLLWSYLFSDKDLSIPSWALLLFFMSLASLFLAPLFAMQPLNNPALLVGVDISAHLFTPAFGLSVSALAFISLLAGFLIFLLSFYHPFKLFFITLGGFLVSSFFGWYLALYFLDQFDYFVYAISALFHLGNFFIAFQFALIFLILIFFYCAGYFVCVTEFFKELKTTHKH